MKRLAAVLFVLSFLPSFWAVSTIALISSSPSNSWSYSWASQDGSWNASIRVQYSRITFSGMPMPITVSLKLNLTGPFPTLRIDSATIQVRDPLQVDPNSTLVLQWRTLNYLDLGWAGNYSNPTALDRQVALAATPPPAVTLPDAFSITRRFALNVDVIGEVFHTPANFDYVEFSFLDDVSLYSNQLSQVYLMSTFLTYQLFSTTAALLTLLLLALHRPKNVDRLYGRELETFRIRRSLESLKAMHERNEISDVAYAELERQYLSQLDETL